MTDRRRRIVPGPHLRVIDPGSAHQVITVPGKAESPAIRRRWVGGRGPAAELDRLVGGFALAASADAPRGPQVVVATRHAEAALHGLLTAGGRSWVPRIARRMQGPSMIAWCAFPGRPHDKPPSRAPIACLACGTCTSRDRAPRQGSCRRLGGGGTCPRCGAFWRTRPEFAHQVITATGNDDRRVQGAGTGNDDRRVQGQGRRSARPARNAGRRVQGQGTSRPATNASRPAPRGAAWRAGAPPGRRTPRTPCRHRRSSRRPPASALDPAPPRSGCAEPGRVLSTRSNPASRISTGRSRNNRRSRSSPLASASRRRAGIAYALVPPRPALTRPSSATSRLSSPGSCGSRVRGGPRRARPASGSAAAPPGRGSRAGGAAS